jgi:hypothetical protein
LPPFPTNAEPGSPEKIAILKQRSAMKVSLHHPDDVTVSILTHGIPRLHLPLPAS